MNIQLYCIDIQALVLSLNTNDVTNELKNLKVLVVFSKLKKDHELFSQENEKDYSKFKMATPKKEKREEFVCSMSRASSFKCGCDKKKNLKVISKPQLKSFNFKEDYNCLIGREYQKECDNFNKKSGNPDIYLQKVRKSTFSAFDEKRKYINNIESTPWNYY